MVLLPEHKEALLHIIDTYPGKWKQEVRKQWGSPFCVPSLRALRNTKGPSWLDKLTADKVRNSLVRVGNTLVDSNGNVVDKNIYLTKDNK